MSEAKPKTSPTLVFDDQPLVSCIMPTRNRRDFIPRSLEYFLAQDYPNLELIIVDDGSDPIADLLPRDDRIRYFVPDRPLTVGAKRNYACERASGEIVVHWDDDDWYSANRVRAQVQSLQSASFEVSGTSVLYFHDAVAQKTFLYRYHTGRKPWVAGTSLAYRRSFWQSHRFPDIQVGEDARFVWSASHKSICDLQDVTLCVASIHVGNISPRRTTSSYWKPVDTHEVLAIMGERRMNPPAPPVARTTSISSPQLLAGETTPIPANPLVSCIMPTLNRRAFIPLALNCFQSQTYPWKELIVVDDGSDPVGDLLEGVAEVHYVRVPQRMTIGGKRNLACREARGKIIAHWDDDDWCAPTRLERQIAPLLDGADMTGLVNHCLLQLSMGRFWRIADHLHRRMFAGDIHGRTIVYWKNALNGFLYPETNLAEDAALIRQAMRQRKRIVRVEEDELFVYLRHGRNAWQFQPGTFLDPSGWSPTSVPPAFSPELLERYMAAGAQA